MKPILRGVWAPKGERPVALGHHRYAWLYLTAFVQPGRGKVVWYLSDGIGKPLFQALLAGFAEQTGAGRDKTIVLVLDNAGWHGPAGLSLPDGLRLVYLPAYTPEMQPAECIWPLVNEPVANKHFDTLAALENTIAERCRTLDTLPEAIRGAANFHWWPSPPNPN